MSREVVKESFIAAEPDEVWQALTDARELTRWFPVEARVEPGLGGSIWLSWGEGAGAIDDGSRVNPIRNGDETAEHVAGREVDLLAQPDEIPGPGGIYDYVIERRYSVCRD